ncbi:hypothetical protein BBD42_13030 [Paenibacillus sp. BIHB 4019]|uniref:YopX protein domain-containing protein n=1 Tax=Paenibacillus sp. BIHB 4019 TaxID=1870819 RepID=A0A1B2DHU2_9BACL|nr:YopX family protein [Paenibacillus sp. BIHB 4019]ANY67294.1 hypothetical protein BBD42_13030 [Paenibacillus sp. BIHB 4019]
MSTREIKFRGKRTDNGEWVVGNLINMKSAQHYGEYDRDETIFSKCWIVEIAEYLEVRAFSSGNAVWADNEFIQVDPETVGQYIGRKDDTETEVYEGDKVMAILTGEVFELIWDGDGFLFQKGNYAIDPLEFEDVCAAFGYRIVGNVHDDKGVSGND